MNKRETNYTYKSGLMRFDGTCEWYSVAITDDVLPGFQKKYIRGKNPVPLVVALEIREIDSKEFICVIERRFVHHSMNREDWYTRIVKQWDSTEENMILANEFFDEYRKESKE